MNEMKCLFWGLVCSGHKDTKEKDKLWLQNSLSSLCFSFSQDKDSWKSSKD